MDLFLSDPLAWPRLPCNATHARIYIYILCSASCPPHFTIRLDFIFFRMVYPSFFVVLSLWPYLAPYRFAAAVVVAHSRQNRPFRCCRPFTGSKPHLPLLKRSYLPITPFVVFPSSYNPWCSNFGSFFSPGLYHRRVPNPRCSKPSSRSAQATCRILG